MVHLPTYLAGLPQTDMQPHADPKSIGIVMWPTSLVGGERPGDLKRIKKVRKNMAGGLHTYDLPLNMSCRVC